MSKAAASSNTNRYRAFLPNLYATEYCDCDWSGQSHEATLGGYDYVRSRYSIKLTKDGLAAGFLIDRDQTMREELENFWVPDCQARLEVGNGGRCR